jgi:hypothetical protein
MVLTLLNRVIKALLAWRAGDSPATNHQETLRRRFMGDLPNPDHQEIIRVLKALAGRPLANPCQVSEFYGSAAFWPLVITGFIRVVSHPTLFDHAILEITRDGRNLLRVAAVADYDARLQRQSLQGRARSDPGM